MDVFTALAEPTRRKILELLAQHGALPASTIYAHFSASAPAISQHLKILLAARLVVVEKNRQQRIYRLNPEAIQELEGWAGDLRRMWEQRFDSLEQVLKAEMQKTQVSHVEETGNT